MSLAWRDNELQRRNRERERKRKREERVVPVKLIYIRVRSLAFDVVHRDDKNWDWRCNRNKIRSHFFIDHYSYTLLLASRCQMHKVSSQVLNFWNETKIVNNRKYWYLKINWMYFPNHTCFLIAQVNFRIHFSESFTFFFAYATQNCRSFFVPIIINCDIRASLCNLKTASHFDHLQKRCSHELAARNFYIEIIKIVALLKRLYCGGCIASTLFVYIHGNLLGFLRRDLLFLPAPSQKKSWKRAWDRK